MFEFEVGDVLKEKISGFTGTVMCCSRYLTGCNRYSLLPEGLNKEKLPHSDWHAFDENSLELIKNGKALREKIRPMTVEEITTNKIPGGPRHGSQNPLKR